MKSLLCYMVFTLTWWLVTPATATTIALDLDSIPSNGILLDKGWKFQVGDNSNWASSSFDDSRWLKSDPTVNITSLPQLKQAGMGWFRLRLKVHSKSKNKVVGLMINQWGASEIYLNGRLVRKFGKVSVNPAEVKAYNPSGEPIAASEIVHVYLDQNTEQVMAVRYALQPDIPDIPYLSSFNPVLKIRLNSADKLNENSLVSRGYLDMTPIDYFKGGLFLVLGFLHLVFFIYYSKQKANLFIAIFCLSAALFYSLLAFSFHVVHVLGTRVIIQLLLSCLFIGQNTILLIAIYFLFKQRKGLIYWLFIGTSIGLIIQTTVSY